MPALMVLPVFSILEKMEPWQKHTALVVAGLVMLVAFVYAAAGALERQRGGKGE